MTTPPPSASDDVASLIDTLSDARAYHEKEYAWEKQRIGNGGSRIAMGQARRYADAIAQAALILGTSTTYKTPDELQQLRTQRAADVAALNAKDGEIADTREKAMQDCWNTVDDLIVSGPLDTYRTNERNGIILATNAISALIQRERAAK